MKAANNGRGHANGWHSLEDRKLQSRAHYEVSKAIMKGKLVRPKKCEQCGEEPGDDIGGRSKIVGHHHSGYENPLDVQWLCQRCNIRLGLIRDPREPEPPPPAINILEGGTYGSAERRSNLPQLQYLYDPNHPDRMVD